LLFADQLLGDFMSFLLGALGICNVGKSGHTCTNKYDRNDMPYCDH